MTWLKAMGDGMGRWVALAAKITVSVLLVWLALRAVDFTAVGARWAQLDPTWLVPVAILLACQIPVASWRWGRICRALGMAVTLYHCLWVTTASMFFNQTLPSVVGGDAMRVWLSRTVLGGVRRATRTVLIDRGAGLVGLLLLGTLCLPGSLAVVDDDMGRLTLVSIVGGGIAGAAVFFLAGLLPEAGPRTPVALVEIRRLVSGAIQVMLRPRPGIWIWSAALIGHLLTIAVLYCLAKGLDMGLTPTTALFVVPPVLLISALPITVAGWGLREGAMIAALDHVDVPAADAFALSVLFGLVQMLVGAVGGLVWLAAHDTKAPGREGASVPDEAGNADS